MTDWTKVNPSYKSYTQEPMTPEEIDSLPPPFDAMVWATVVEVKVLSYEDGYNDGYDDCTSDREI